MTDAGERTTGPDRTTLAAFVTFVTLAGGNVDRGPIRLVRGVRARTLLGRRHAVPARVR